MYDYVNVYFIYSLLITTAAHTRLGSDELIGLQQNVSVFSLAELTELTCSAGNVNN